jgi:hypothetical protein
LLRLADFIPNPAGFENYVFGDTLAKFNCFVYPMMNDSDKQYELTLEERTGYLYARVKADKISEQLAMAYLDEVVTRCRSLKCTKLLLERDIPDMLPDGALFFIAEKFQKMIAGIKVAFVNKFAENDEAFDFAVRVGTNRGADYGIFDNATNAERWLLGV